MENKINNEEYLSKDMETLFIVHEAGAFDRHTIIDHGLVITKTEEFNRRNHRIKYYVHDYGKLVFRGAFGEFYDHEIYDYVPGEWEDKIKAYIKQDKKTR